MSRVKEPTTGVVAFTLALGLALAINLIVVTTLWVAVVDNREIGENATQLMNATFGGIIGVLGSYLGFKAGARAATNGTTTEGTPDEPPA